MKFKLLLILFSIGVVNTAPIASTSNNNIIKLNLAASVLMDWYFQLLINNKQILTNNITNKYKNNYPKNITQIQLTNNKFTKVDKNQYKFNIELLLSYIDNDDIYNQLINETFIFEIKPLAKPLIKNIVRNKTKKIKTSKTLKFNSLYYQARKFAYTWLSYIDGVEVIKSSINTNKWLDKAKYLITIGGHKINDYVKLALNKRKKYLAKGEHLLRLLNITKINNKDNYFILNLTIDWKGVNQKGKKLLAKIQQEITIKLTKNNFNVISIKEKHLLPDIAPWVGILC